MSMFRKFATMSLIASTLAVASIVSTAPALAHGGGHGGGGHGGGFEDGRGGFEGAHFGDHEGFAGRPDHFAGRFHDRRPFLFGDGDNDEDDCYPDWRYDRLGHPYRWQACPFAD